MKTKEKHIISAIADGNGIGYNGDLLWRIPSDLRHFKELTLGNIVIMGRKTYESIGSRPLKGRTNIVVTSSVIDGVHCVRTLEDAYNLADTLDGQKVFVIGGGQLYKSALPYTDVLDITRIYATPEDVDTVFPADISEFEICFKSEIFRGKDVPNYQFITYKRPQSVILY